MMRKQIEASTEVRRRILEEIGIKERSLIPALKYQRNGSLSEQARRMALELGGRIVCIIPENEAIHDAEERLSQTMPNGAIIVCDKTTGDIRVEYNGDLIATYPNARISTLSTAQALARGL